jgi:arylsulfatase A-like enzyme
MRRRTLLGALTAAGGIPFANRAAARPRPKNVLVIMADDVGYGDLSAYGATKVRTPNLDRLARAGIRFTHAHSSSATCTPTRYSLMTGEYAFRKPGTGILPGDAALIVEPGRTTLGTVMKDAGYRTGVVGKWHLGLGVGVPDWNNEIKPGPREIGFDYSFLIPATGDRVPTVYVENQRVAGLDPADPIRVSYKEKVGTEPTGRENPDLLRMGLSRGHDMTIVNGISRIGWMTGGKKARWVDEDMADTLASKAVAFIERNRRNPFFLYFATHDIHVPRAPHARFKGRSACGVRCDALQELDDSVGRVLAALDQHKLTEDTLVIFTSDNGPVLDDGYADGAVENLNGHTPAGGLRGTKGTIYEGGTRVPFLVRWPKRVKPGVSDALVGQIDLLASFASLTGQTLKPEAAPDSFDLLPALLGESPQGRDHIVEYANRLALRKGPWKYIPAFEGAPGKAPKKGPATAELYRLAGDPAETKNVLADHPDVVRSLAGQLEQIRKAGRTRP